MKYQYNEAIEVTTLYLCSSNFFTLKYVNSFRVISTEMYNEEKDKLTIFTVLKSSEFFLCSLFIYYFLENAWWISLLSSTYSGKQKEKILLLLQQWGEIICYCDWKQLLQESVLDDCNIVICCTRNNHVWQHPIMEQNLSQIKQIHCKLHSTINWWVNAGVNMEI
jgi:hypothetical protein